MTLFLGQAANYRAKDIFRHTFAFASSDYSLMLRQYLAKRYGVTPVSTSTNHASDHSGVKHLSSPDHPEMKQPTFPDHSEIKYSAASGHSGENPLSDIGHAKNTPDTSHPCNSSDTSHVKDASATEVDISRVYLYHNGRSALAAALQALVPRGSGVIINGFTCHAVAEAVRAAGCTPVYADVQPDTLHYNVENLKITLKSSLEKSTPTTITASNASTDTFGPTSNFSSIPPIRALIIQNTLGIPVDIVKIEKFAKKHHLILIEDLAHCAGRTYPDGREIGTVGHATALSFGKGKAVDTISGGALILRSLPEMSDTAIPGARTSSATPANSDGDITDTYLTSDHTANTGAHSTPDTYSAAPAPATHDTATPLTTLPQPTHLPPLSDRLRDRWYPLLGRLIRTGYYLKLNKVLTAIFLKLHWISRSADATLSTSIRLPHWQAKLALHQLLRLQPPLSPLRQHAFVDDRDAVLTKLEKNGYKFDEIWYDVPVSPARYYAKQIFPEESCPAAVWAAQHIVNLPTFYPDKKLKNAHQIINSAKITPPSDIINPKIPKNSAKTEQNLKITLKSSSATSQNLEDCAAKDTKKSANPTTGHASNLKTPISAHPDNSETPTPEPETPTPEKSQNLTSNWQNLIKSHPEANFLQSPSWAETNRLIGHEVLARNFGDGNFALMIIKHAKRGRYLEIPGGPLIDWEDSPKVEKIFSEIREIAKTHHCAFIRLRPQLPKTEQNLKILQKLGAKPAPFHLHAEHTVILDLNKSEDDLLAAMRRQTRYEVRRAIKQGITVEKFTSTEKFKEFHAVQSETARRQNFVPPSLDMLLAEHQAFGDNAQLYIAYTADDVNSNNTNNDNSRDKTPAKNQTKPQSLAENQAQTKTITKDPAQTKAIVKDLAQNQASNSVTPEIPPHSPIAYGLILTSGPEAEYFEAASTDLGRKLPGAYALQWQVIRDLKSAGIQRYNLWGIAPPDQPHHRYAKVTTFKTGFGGEATEFVPAHDIIISNVKYLPNLAIETMRKKRRHLS